MRGLKDVSSTMARNDLPALCSLVTVAALAGSKRAADILYPRIENRHRPIPARTAESSIAYPRTTRVF